MRHNPRPTFGAVLLVQGIVYIVAIGAVSLVTFLSLSRLDSATTQDQQQILVGSYTAIGLSALVSVLLSMAASALLQGVIVLDVMRATLGEKPKLRQLLAMAKSRIWALIGWTLMVALAVVVAFGAVVALIVLFAVSNSVAGIVLAVLVGIFGALGLATCWVWLGTKLALVPSVLMAERTSIRAAMRRSWALTTRSFWKTFGILLLVSAIIAVATQVVTTPISVVFSLLTGLADPNGQSEATAIGGSIAVYGLLVVVSVVFGAIGAVIQSATVALVYLDLRMRKEGLDIELARFVESRHSGDAGLGDPYARQPATAPATPAYSSYAPPTVPAPSPSPSPVAAPRPNPPAPPPPSNDSPWT